MWHDAQAAVTACWVWFHLLGAQPDGATLWQVRQLSAVGMCVADLPLALTPWQLAQLVEAV